MTTMFARKPKIKPKVITDNFELSYDKKYDNWGFTYKNIEFAISGPEIKLPSQDELSQYISWVEAHKTHIDKNVKEMCEGYNDAGVFVDPEKAHIALISIESKNKITVMILGDDTWGDMGYDLWIDGGIIVNEGFSD